MAKVWEYQGRADMPTITEDARPGNAGFYIDGIKHDKTSLTPQFMKKVNYQYQAGVSTWSHPVTSGWNDTYAVHGAQLGLSKMTGSMSGYQTNGTGHYNYPWDGSYMDLSGTLKMGTTSVISNGTKETQIHSWHDTNYQYVRKWPHMADSVDLDQVNPSAGNSSNKGPGNTQHAAYLHETVGTSDGVFCWFRSSGNTNHYNYPSYHYGVHYGTFPDAQPNFHYTYFNNMNTYFTVQYLGKSTVDGGHLFVGTKAGTGSSGVQTHVMKAVWGSSYTPTWTTMFQNNTAPSASGTSQGGNMMNNVDTPTNCSAIFDDPRGTANTKVFYRNYYDSYRNFHPFVMTWDTSTDTFARETDISCDVLSSVHSDMSSYALEDSNYKCQMLNLQTWMGGSTRYLCDMKLDGKPSAKDGNSNYRTWVTYSVGASDPRALTYHSKVTVPSTPRSMIWLNDSHTMMGIWFQNSFGIYSWNNTTGWNSTTTLNHMVMNIGRDSLDRIWYIKQSSKYGASYTELHLLTPTLPVSITVVPETAAYTYSGTVITSYINVSAINASGTRIASSVKLVIEGSSMTFADDSTSKTVTTLTSGDLQVATKVKSAGFTNVSASIEI